MKAGLQVSSLSRRVFLVSGIAFVAACSTTQLPPGSRTLSHPSRAQAIELINATRRAHGRAALAYSSKLAEAARQHVNRMAAAGEVSHTLGGTLRERVRAVGYQGAVGENLGGGQPDLQAAIDGWLSSNSHRNTLLSPNFTEFGLAATTGKPPLNTYWAIILGGDAGNFFTD